MENKKPYEWKIVPLTKNQLMDVSPADILYNGHFRKCNTYKGGGGYDKFPEIAEKRFGEKGHNLHFVVQLFGCNLDCPYCYVTREGVWGDTSGYISDELVSMFNKTECSVFHLMGGAPALYMKHWPELIAKLQEFGKPGWVFHSDIMLSEGIYDEKVLSEISVKRALYAVNIKGVTKEEYESNTRKTFNPRLMFDNLIKLEKSSVPYYFTFTNVGSDGMALFWNVFHDHFGEKLFRQRYTEAYSIDLIEYNALPYVDSVEWGRINKKRYF